VPPERRRAWLEERIAAECAGLLALRGAIEKRRPLQELGLDSLAALELRNRLGRLVDAALPAGLLFDYPTIAALSEHLATAYFGLAPERGPQPLAEFPPEAEPETDELAALSDSALDAAFAAFAELHDGAPP
jgi:acyl carrier protein